MGLGPARQHAFVALCDIADRRDWRVALTIEHPKKTPKDQGQSRLDAVLVYPKGKRRQESALLTRVWVVDQSLDDVAVTAQGELEDQHYTS